MNLIANLRKFLSELQNHFPNFYSLSENTDGTLIISVKQEILSDADKMIPFIDFLVPMIKRLKLSEYVVQELLKDPNNLERKGVPMLVGVEYHINRTSLYINQLKDHFAPAITKTEIAQAIGFLLNHGWTERKFQAEIHMSRATLYRYQVEIEKSHSETTVAAFCKT